MSSFRLIGTIGIIEILRLVDPQLWFGSFGSLLVTIFSADDTVLAGHGRERKRLEINGRIVE